MEIIDWLNANDGAIMGIATIVLVSIIGYYAYLTRRLLKINDTPEIAVSLCPHEAHIHCVMLCIENIGTGAARDIRFQTNLSFKPDGERALEDVSFLRNGIGYLGPGQKREHFLVSIIDKLDDLKKTPIEIGVTYTDTLKKVYQCAFHLDFGENDGYARVGKPPLFEIAEAAQSIKRNLHHLTTGVYKPIILTEPLDEHRIGKRASSLEKRIDQLPHEVQQEILKEFNTVVGKQEHELVKKARNAETPTDKNTS